jgi:uncharacterized cupredoxin-like copper-binding protein
MVSAVSAALILLTVGCSSSGGTKATTTAAGGNTTAGTDVTIPTNDGQPVSLEASDQSATAQSFKISTDSVKSGKVTFTFVNKGNRQHEMIVLKTDTPFDQLTVGSDDKVSEDASVGEISETDAGKTVIKTFDLKPGKYVLVCNIAKHYSQGMRVAFTVTQ